MGSPLGALFANIYMCKLEDTIIPKLEDNIFSWTRYVDDTFSFIKPCYEMIVQRELNNFHQNIKFTYEIEENEKIAFLDPSTWKIATMKSLIKQALLISSTPTTLECELKHIKKVFVDKNDYPEHGLL